jgi:hypothetical protein
MKNENTTTKPRGKKQKAVTCSTPSAAPRPDAQAPQAVSIKPLSSQPGELKAIGGSRDDQWNMLMLNQAREASWRHTIDRTALEKSAQHIASPMEGIAPRDEIEGMLAAQMVTMHNVAMECMRKVLIDGQTLPGGQFFMNASIRLMRAYASHVETLDKRRGGGQQKVTVEHVHVHQGGQAIVGNVTHQGVGQNKQIEGRPDAKDLALSHLAALPSSDPQRDAVPIAEGEGAQALPDAWRR